MWRSSSPSGLWFARHRAGLQPLGPTLFDNVSCGHLRPVSSFTLHIEIARCFGCKPASSVLSGRWTWLEAWRGGSPFFWRCAGREGQCHKPSPSWNGSGWSSRSSRSQRDSEAEEEVGPGGVLSRYACIVRARIGRNHHGWIDNDDLFQLVWIILMHRMRTSYFDPTRGSVDGWIAAVVRDVVRRHTHRFETPRATVNAGADRRDDRS